MEWSHRDVELCGDSDEHNKQAEITEESSVDHCDWISSLREFDCFPLQWITDLIQSHRTLMHRCLPIGIGVSF